MWFSNDRCTIIVCLVLSVVFNVHGLKTGISFKRIGTKTIDRIKSLSMGYNVDEVSSQNLDWPNLGFTYRQTNSFIVCKYKDGKWGSIESQTDPYLPIHIGATSLHYGQACFEGLKAFQGKDKRVRVFRPDENAKRIRRSCARVCMPEIPDKLFLEAVNKAVRENLAFVPPYGTPGGALYIRPLVYGSGPRIGLQPADEYMFVIMVLPVADYYQGGLSPVPAMIVDGYDRAAPRGVGNVKVAGNYAADILPNMEIKQAGYPIALYLDAKTNEYIEEFSTSNFVAIDKKGDYHTPKSDAILKSITNKSLIQIAKDDGRQVFKRNIAVKEVMDGDFAECGACGTAVVVTPVNKVCYKDKVTTIGGESTGPVMQSLYDRIRGIQNGETEDKHGWMAEI